MAPMEIVYLDQNHWIELAKVHSGRVANGPLADLYLELCAVVDRGAALFPLSASHIVETSKRNDQTSRENLASTQARLSAGHVYRSRRGLLTREVRIALHRAFDLEAPPLLHYSAIAPGFLQAFEPFDASISTCENAAFLERLNQWSSPSAQYLDFINNQDDHQRRLAHQMLGVVAEAAIDEIQSRRIHLQGQSIDVRRRVYAAIVFDAHQELFQAALREIGRSLSDLISLGDEALRMLIYDIPILNVETELAIRIEGEFGVLSANDLFDVQAMYTSIPYSTLIIAEKATISRARQAGLGKRYNVQLHTSLDSLRGRY